jgi:predicted ester cyclase
MGISPTGNEIAIGVIFICRIIEGKIVEIRGEGDKLSTMQQLGMELKPKEEK